MLAPVSVVVPPPANVSRPVPLIALAIVTLSLWLIARAPLSVTAPDPSVPTVVPLPTCNVPALIVVAPL